MTTVYDLVEQLGGEIVRGRARVRVGSEYVIIGWLNGDNMEFTEEGRRLAAGGASIPQEAVVVESSQEDDSQPEDTAVPQDLFD